MNKKYQLNYAAGRPQMYDQQSREQKAKRIIKTLKNYFGEKDLKRLTLLDIGCSTGIIANSLAKKFKKVVATDIDEQAIRFAKKTFNKKNLQFKIADALKFSFKENSFDVVVCTHVYEHVTNPNKLFKEIERVLKPGGVCYLAAVNKLWPMEPHYNLLFLSYLPKSLAHVYVKITFKADKYFETLKTYWQLKKLTGHFERREYTDLIFRSPKKFGYDDVVHPESFISKIYFALSPLAKYLAPTFFWLLVKK